ncbi:hypothetical protein ACNQVK_01870 [Mycobacterium sp. 134]|uniref:hypothetical protein n=1 Tax=Mycobacterium sp. 134 TaxID=3400425 RepID=UPI003AAEB7C5
MASPELSSEHPDRLIYEIRTSLGLMIQADDDGDSAEFKAQALHMADHFETLDRAIRNGSLLPTDWQEIQPAGPHPPAPDDGRSGQRYPPAATVG